MNTNCEYIKLGKISIEVIRKDIKNLYLNVYPPIGKVRISAPITMELEIIRMFCISKLAWIQKEQTKLQNQQRETPREYLYRESHYYLGKRYLLNIIEQNSVPKVVLQHSTIDLYIRPGASLEKKKSVLNNWYRKKLKEIIPKYISTLEKKMCVKVAEFRIKKMKTKWGTCNQKAKRIWLNLELAKKPLECLEYIITHEMVHLLERNHNERFIAYMDTFLPQWKQYRKELNRSPLGYVDWGY